MKKYVYNYHSYPLLKLRLSGAFQDLQRSTLSWDGSCRQGGNAWKCQNEILEMDSAFLSGSSHIYFTYYIYTICKCAGLGWWFVSLGSATPEGGRKAFVDASSFSCLLDFEFHSRWLFDVFFDFQPYLGKWFPIWRILWKNRLKPPTKNLEFL